MLPGCKDCLRRADEDPLVRLRCCAARVTSFSSRAAQGLSLIDVPLILRLTYRSRGIWAAGASGQYGVMAPNTIARAIRLGSDAWPMRRSKFHVLGGEAPIGEDR
eukprot:4382367-Pleurochrysis_carterae.AAC.3